MNTLARIPVSLMTAVCMLAAATITCAQELDRDTIAKVKAAYLLNFAKFTTWPDDEPKGAETQSNQPIVFGFLGDDRDGIDDVLNAMVQNESIRNRPLIVKRFRAHPLFAWHGSDDSTEREALFQELRSCHVLFFTMSVERHIDTVLDELRGTDVLTVSDIPQFAEDGGMLALTLNNNRIVFEANTTAIQASGLEVSSKLLKLAHRIHDEENK